MSEFSIGVYDQYGDGACDISILKHLSKTQIKQLAKHIGVPDHIVNKPSSGYVFGVSLPNEELIGLSYLKLDDILCGKEKCQICIKFTAIAASTNERIRNLSCKTNERLIIYRNLIKIKKDNKFLQNNNNSHHYQKFLYIRGDIHYLTN